MANIEGKVSTNTFQFKQEKLNVNLSYIAAVESNYTVELLYIYIYIYTYIYIYIYHIDNNSFRCNYPQSWKLFDKAY